MMWMAMRREKRDRKHFKRNRLPPFDDEQPPINFGDKLVDLESPDPITEQLDPEEDNLVIDWIFDGKPLEETEFVNGPSYKSYKLDLEMVKNIHRLSDQLISDIYDKNYYYLFNDEHFMNAKALNLAIPGGPKFEPLFRDTLEDYDDDWNEFNDLNKIIIRHPIRTEYKVAFPNLYNSRPRRIIQTVHSRPLLVYIPPENVDEEPFKFHKQLNPLNRNEITQESPL